MARTIGCAQQIVGRERRERLSQLAWCGGGCFDSRRRVNSTVGHLHMNITKLSPIVLVLLLVACVKPPVITPSSQAEADKAIDHTKARELSDSIAENLLKDDRVSLRNQMEKGAREGYAEKSF